MRSPFTEQSEEVTLSSPISGEQPAPPPMTAADAAKASASDGRRSTARTISDARRVRHRARRAPARGAPRALGARSCGGSSEHADCTARGEGEDAQRYDPPAHGG